jgi:phosphoesterase RecJ-like protein
VNPVDFAQPHATTPEQADALRCLRAARQVLLVGHQRPDGDVIGSQGALYAALTEAGKRVHIVNPDPADEGLAFLTDKFPFTAFTGELPEHDAVVFTDLNELERTGPMTGALASGSATKIVVDHHLASGEPWWDAAYVDVTASATGILAARIADELGHPLHGAGAEAAFLALVSDTGWFRFENANSDAFQWASRLTAAGVRPSEVQRALYQKHRPERPHALSRVLSRVQYHLGGRVGVIDLPLAELEHVSPLEGNAAMDVVRSVAGVEVVFLLRELETRQTKLSARATGDAEVHRLAVSFGGGGHAKAAGAEIDARLDKARRLVLERATEIYGVEGNGAEGDGSARPDGGSA